MGQTAYEAYDSAGRRKYLTGSEGKRFLEAAASMGSRERLFCEAMYYLGCRVSEAIRLTQGDIEAGECVIRVLCLKKRGKMIVRRVPVPEDLAQSLVRLQPENGMRLWDLSRMTAWRIVKRVMAQAGISGVHACPKGLRHGFGVRAAMANVTLNVIQRWMGHSDPATTAIYLAVQDDEERKLIARTWK